MHILESKEELDSNAPELIFFFSRMFCLILVFKFIWIFIWVFSPSETQDSKFMGKFMLFWPVSLSSVFAKINSVHLLLENALPLSYALIQ